MSDFGSREPWQRGVGFRVDGMEFYVVEEVP